VTAAIIVAFKYMRPTLAVNLTRPRRSPEPLLR
jgi:hypothetical protein